MYGLKLYERIFSEAEILALTEQHIKLFEKLMDDNLGQRTIEFFNEFDKSAAATDDNFVALALQDKVAKMKEILLPVAKRYTIHLEVRERGIMELVRDLRIDNFNHKIPDNEQDSALEKITWVLDNRENLTPEIPPQSAESWKQLLKAVKEIIHEAEYWKFTIEQAGFPEFEMTDDLRGRLEANKVLFTTKGNAAKSNGIGFLITHRQELELIQHGLIYTKKCRERNISKRARRRLMEGW